MVTWWHRRSLEDMSCCTSVFGLFCFLTWLRSVVLQWSRAVKCSLPEQWIIVLSSCDSAVLRIFGLVFFNIGEFFCPVIFRNTYASRFYPVASVFFTELTLDRWFPLIWCILFKCYCGGCINILTVLLCNCITEDSELLGAARWLVLIRLRSSVYCITCIGFCGTLCAFRCYPVAIIAFSHRNTEGFS